MPSKLVQRNEVLSIGDYEAVRAQFRNRVIEEKKARRVAIGERATALFENHDTALLQIQEMLRTERITREAAILHEIETYNEFIPGDRELSCTIMINVDDKEERERFLFALAGVEKTIALVVDGKRYPASWDERRVEADRASAVLYLKFPIDDDAIDALRAAARGGAHVLEIEIDHDAYRSRAALDRRVLVSLAEDFA